MILSLQKLYRELLLENIAPFWLKYGIDWQYGGVLTCMDDSGAVLSGDKYIWSQARSVWTFSALFNRIERRPEYLRAAENSVRFLLQHGRDEHGRWFYRTDREGAPVEGAISIYADCFAVYGLSEYYRATGDSNVLAVAQSTWERIVRRVQEPDFSETAPYSLPPGRKTHGVPMMLTEVGNELFVTCGSAGVEDVVTDSVREIMEHFVRPSKRRLLEFLSKDWKELLGNEGTAIMPGHAIESMWFVLHVAKRRGDRDLIRRATEVIRWHLEAGWDPEYGGIFLGIDAEGNEPFVRNWEKKAWWPHTEALYALLLAHQLTGEPWCMEWYERVHEWSFAHFPNEGAGEWRQRLNRDGTPTDEVFALPVKDPFHLPRAAILITQLFNAE